MKKISFIIILLICAVQFSKGQEKPAQDFYLHLLKTVTITSFDTITLTAIDYGCLGTKINWEAKIKKIGNLIRVDFYAQKPRDITIPTSELETKLDTTFIVEKDIFKQNVKAEISEIKSRVFLIEANFKISLNRGKVNDEFIFKRGEGLYYLLRYNKTLANYFAKK